MFRDGDAVRGGTLRHALRHFATCCWTTRRTAVVPHTRCHYSVRTPRHVGEHHWQFSPSNMPGGVASRITAPPLPYTRVPLTTAWRAMTLSARRLPALYKRQRPQTTLRCSNNTTFSLIPHRYHSRGFAGLYPHYHVLSNPTLPSICP